MLVVLNHIDEVPVDRRESMMSTYAAWSTPTG
jgi:hypothetical protein